MTLLTHLMLTSGRIALSSERGGVTVWTLCDTVEGSSPGRRIASTVSQVLDSVVKRFAHRLTALGLATTLG
jgi:hypothetical protein